MGWGVQRGMTTMRVQMMCETAPKPQTGTGHEARGTGGGTLPMLNAAELFSAGREVLIRHAGDIYRLRLTSNNKLILTK